LNIKQHRSFHFNFLRFLKNYSSRAKNAAPPQIARSDAARYCAKGATRKKAVATVSRCECVYKRTGEPSVPFCE